MSKPNSNEKDVILLDKEVQDLKLEFEMKWKAWDQWIKKEFKNRLKLLFNRTVEILDRIELDARCLGCDDVKEFIDEYGISELESSGLVDENFQCICCHGSGKDYITLYSVFINAEERAGMQWNKQKNEFYVDIKYIVDFIDQKELMPFIKYLD